ncbi:regulatory protein MarR [Syntrophobotulus glycolicus DSM 8271]|uniref:Regulatory protein MarR n=1 Tax=Syntrophobotulus glycolicus (strain DSM 8271 / FlGlyR) TaxID=645991 RepID=F0T1Z1_SYNGF|nr:MarR family transcriptional regulator [Syntrophobotulus glycolicus]ADY55255.1 regulatory protein MarR [Syntrophobotulus glycolicus DSM 8271]
MNQKLRILDTLIKIQEHSDVFEPKLAGLLDEISLAEVHCIDWIGRLDHPNVTKISEKMGLTRGAISKISKKLLSKGLIETYQEPDNHKEIYFRLTESGRSVYGEHKKLHNEVREEWLSFLEHYSEDEQAVLFRFLTEIGDLLDRKWADQ